MLNTSNMWDMYQKKSDSKNFFKTLGVGDLQVPSVLDFAGESPLGEICMYTPGKPLMLLLLM